MHQSQCKNKKIQNPKNNAVSIAAQMQRYPGSWETRDATKSLYRLSRERFPQSNNSAQVGRVSQTSCYSSSLLAESFPSQSVLQFCSAGLQGKLLQRGSSLAKCRTALQTLLKGFIGKEESRRVAVSRVRSSSKLNRVQSQYRVSWEWSFLGWLFLVWLWSKLGIGGVSNPGPGV